MMAKSKPETFNLQIHSNDNVMISDCNIVCQLFTLKVYSSIDKSQK